MSTSAPANQPDLLEFAIELAHAAGEVILPHFRASADFENKAAKSPFDPVTEADRAGERVIRERILERHPGHSIRGEEYPDHNGEDRFTWVLDPIDGTKAFIMGVPVWSTLIGLLEAGEPVAGVMNQPYVSEYFAGSPDGAWTNGPGGRKELRTRNVTSLDEALIGTTFPGPSRTSETFLKYLALEESARGARLGGDAYFYCLLAAGHMDLVVDAAMGDYDIVALIPIVEAAGGIVTTWDGGPATSGGNIVAAATRDLHSAALDILAG